MHKAKEIVISSHRSMKEKEARHILAVKAFELAEKRIQELNTQLTKAELDKKSVETALNGVEKQAEAQWNQIHQAEDKLATTKSQIQVEEAKKAKDQAKQDGYEARVAETEKALKAEVLEVCRYYCLQV